MADVQRQHLQQVLAQHAVFGQPHRRQAQALVPDLRRRRIVGAVRRTADVGMMRPDHRPEHQRALGEHRHEHGQVGQMRAAAIGIVQQIDVVRRGFGKARRQRLGRPWHGADMHRDMIRLRHQAAARVDQRDGEIPGRVQDLRVGGAQHRLPHLLGDGVQPVLQHGDGDRVGHARMVTHPARVREVGQILVSRDFSDQLHMHSDRERCHHAIGAHAMAATSFVRRSDKQRVTGPATSRITIFGG